MGRSGILMLGAFTIFWMWLAFRFGFPGSEYKLTLMGGLAPAYLAIDLFLKCKCDEKHEKKDPPQKA